MLQQSITAWIGGGWPLEDIYIVENTETFDDNKRALLASSYAQFLNHERLTNEWTQIHRHRGLTITVAFDCATSLDVVGNHMYNLHMDLKTARSKSHKDK